MALGDTNSRGAGTGKKLFENTYYSRVKMKDADNKLSLSFQFKSGMLIVDIAKEKEGFNYETVCNIFITPTKSKILLKEIEAFENMIASGESDPNRGFGINTGMGDISTVLAFHTTADGNKAVFIGKVDGSGAFQSSIDFVFSKQFHYGIQWSNIAEMKLNKDFVEDIDYNSFVETIRQFSSASNGTYAYSVADLTRYDTKAVLNKLNPIYDKLGIERGSNGGGRSSDNNFFNNRNNGSDSGNKNSQHKSYEETIEDLGIGD